jgi:hypothetical protein
MINSKLGETVDFISSLWIKKLGDKLETDVIVLERDSLVSNPTFLSEPRVEVLGEDETWKSTEISEDEDTLEVTTLEVIPSNVLAEEEKIFKELKEFLTARLSSKELRPWSKVIGGVETKSDMYHFHVSNTISINSKFKKMSLIRVDESLKLYHWTLKSVITHRNVKLSVR